MNNKNNKAESIVLEEDFLTKIGELFQDRHLLSFLEQVDSLGSLSIKKKLFNTQLIN